jgi:hypothetical protein
MKWMSGGAKHARVERADVDEAVREVEVEVAQHLPSGRGHASLSGTSLSTHPIT